MGPGMGLYEKGEQGQGGIQNDEFMFITGWQKIQGLKANGDIG